MRSLNILPHFINYHPKIHNMAEQKSLAQDLFEDMGRKVAEASAQEGDDDTKVVDEIESLCMNCHEDVRFEFSFIKDSANSHRAPPDSCLPRSHSSARLSSCLSHARIATLRTLKSSPLARYNNEASSSP